MASNTDIIDPPHSLTVDHERKPVLYLPDGRALVRQAGFRQEPQMAKGSGKTPKKGGPKKY